MPKKKTLKKKLLSAREKAAKSGLMKYKDEMPKLPTKKKKKKK